MERDVAQRVWERECQEYPVNLDLARPTPTTTTTDPREALDQLHARRREIQTQRAASRVRNLYDMSSPVAVFMDIDGVVSPIPWQDPYSFDMWEEFAVAFPFTPVHEYVRDWLIQSRPARMLWSSSWSKESAERLSDNLGGGPEEHVKELGETKTQVVEKYLVGSGVTTAIICDDDPYPVDVPGVVVRRVVPDCHVGLTRKDLKRIDNLIEESLWMS